MDISNYQQEVSVSINPQDVRSTYKTNKSALAQNHPQAGHSRKQQYINIIEDSIPINVYSQAKDHFRGSLPKSQMDSLQHITQHFHEMSLESCGNSTADNGFSDQQQTKNSQCCSKSVARQQQSQDRKNRFYNIRVADSESYSGACNIFADSTHSATQTPCINPHQYKQIQYSTRYKLQSLYDIPVEDGCWSISSTSCCNRQPKDKFIAGLVRRKRNQMNNLEAALLQKLPQNLYSKLKSELYEQRQENNSKKQCCYENGKPQEQWTADPKMDNTANIETLQKDQCKANFKPNLQSSQCVGSPSCSSSKQFGSNLSCFGYNGKTQQQPHLSFRYKAVIDIHTPGGRILANVLAQNGWQVNKNCNVNDCHLQWSTYTDIKWDRVMDPTVEPLLTCNHYHNIALLSGTLRRTAELFSRVCDVWDLDSQIPDISASHQNAYKYTPKKTRQQPNSKSSTYVQYKIVQDIEGLVIQSQYYQQENVGIHNNNVVQEHSNIVKGGDQQKPKFPVTLCWIAQNNKDSQNWKENSNRIESLSRTLEKHQPWLLADQSTYVKDDSKIGVQWLHSTLLTDLQVAHYISTHPSESVFLQSFPIKKYAANCAVMTMLVLCVGRLDVYMFNQVYIEQFTKLGNNLSNTDCQPPKWIRCAELANGLQIFQTAQRITLQTLASCGPKTKQFFPLPNCFECLAFNFIIDQDRNEVSSLLRVQPLPHHMPPSSPPRLSRPIPTSQKNQLCSTVINPIVRKLTINGLPIDMVPTEWWLCVLSIVLQYMNIIQATTYADHNLIHIGLIQL